ARGVLLDVAGTLGVENLPAGYGISPAELDRARREANVDIRPGDAVLVNTGWGRYWENPAQYMSGCPGLNADCGSWAVEHEIILWGIDQFCVDPDPWQQEGVALPLHLEMLTRHGIRLFENV